MTLDLTQVISQIEEMAARLKAGEKEREEHLQFALDTLHSCSTDLDRLKEKIEKSKTTWLVAGVREGLDLRYAPSACPPEFTVTASDGSHIDVDRHSPVRCYLINIGCVTLSYGENPDATLLSQTRLYTSDEDLALSDPHSSSQEPVERALLGVKRMVEECHALAHQVQHLPSQVPALALLDGSLILWGLAGQNYPDYVRDEFLANGLLKALDTIKKEVSQGKRLALASYISFPRSTDVVNALRLALCPHDPADCDHYCSGKYSSKECDAIAGVQDRHLFERTLAPGERSATFASLSSVVRKYYRDHEIRFFYLKLEDEVARVEFPGWVEERGLIDLVHTFILDQCRRGQGYPVALTEAHEKAVVTAADRDQFWQLVEQALAENRLPAPTSAKSRSKRTRWI